jgi:hypothetical protein
MGSEIVVYIEYVEVRTYVHWRRIRSWAFGEVGTEDGVADHLGISPRMHAGRTLCPPSSAFCRFHRQICLQVEVLIFRICNNCVQTYQYYR